MLACGQTTHMNAPRVAKVEVAAQGSKIKYLLVTD
jgi:hypothetical protein